MKTLVSCILAAGSCVALAQDPPTTTPVGHTTIPLVQGFNAVGLTLHQTPIAAGAIDVVSGTSLTDSDVTFSPQANRIYVLEITSGVLDGSIQEIPSASLSGSVITTSQDLEALGLIAGDTYRLRLAPTLEEIFTTVPLASGGVLSSALSVGSSDVIWLPNGAGGFDKYYLRTQGGNSYFRSTPANLDTPNVPVVYVDGMLLEKKFSTAATLTVTGEVKMDPTNSTISFGYNLVSIVSPVGLNLYNIGLEDDLKAALSAGSADEVWITQPNGTFVKYFRRSGSGAGWRVSGTTTTLTQQEAEAITLPSSIMIHKKEAGTSPLTLNVPASYTASAQ